MSSCEPSRCSAYSEDLRWRIIWQVEGLKLTYTQVAKNLGVDKSTVSRIQQRFMITGSLSRKSYPKDQAFRKITMPVQLLILHLVVDKPGILLHEIKEELSSGGN